MHLPVFSMYTSVAPVIGPVSGAGIADSKRIVYDDEAGGGLAQACWRQAGRTTPQAAQRFGASSGPRVGKNRCS
jgi:hypothetical protein